MGEIKRDDSVWMSNPVLRFGADFWDGCDPWGSVMSLWFGVANVLHCEGRFGVPDHWYYSPGAGGSEIDESMFPDAELAAMYRSGELTDADLIAAGNVLCKEADALRAQGLDY